MLTKREKLRNILLIHGGTQTGSRVVEQIMAMYTSMHRQDFDGDAAALQKMEAIFALFERTFKEQLATHTESSLDMSEDIYTEDEVEAAHAFFTSPLGKAYGEKQAQLMEKLTELSQQLADRVLSACKDEMERIIDGE